MADPSNKSSNKLDKILFQQFCQSKDTKVFFRGKDHIYAKKTDAYEDAEEKKEYVNHRLKKGSNTYLNRYTESLIDNLEKNSKLE